MADDPTLNTWKASASRSPVAFWLQLLTVVAWASAFAFYAARGAINAPTMHLDGAFQTASGLYRLDAGQWPGDDFFPYLGIGPLFLLYPLFKVFGANLAASVFGAQFLVLILWSGYAALLWHLLSRSRSIVASLAVGCTVFFVATALGKVLDLPVWGFSPGNSLRALRIAAPYFAAIAYLVAFRHIASRMRRAAFAGVLVALLMTWSNDYALVSVASLGTLLLVHSLVRHEFRWRDAAVFTVVAVVASAALLTAVTHAHPLALASYNFRDVAKDQWWFFGPYLEAERVFDLAGLAHLFSKETFFPLLVLVGSGAMLFKTRRLESGLVFWIGTVLFLGGCVSSVGGHLAQYYGGFYMWAMSVALSVVAVYVWSKLVPTVLQQPADAPSGAYMSAWPAAFKTSTRLSLGMAALAVACLGAAVYIHEGERRGAAKDPERFYVERLGAYLPVAWKSYVAMATDAPGGRVIEEYWGIWSAIGRSFPSWPVDAAIHALGGVRANARESLHDTDLVVTTRASFSPPWQQWALSQNYWLYQALFENFEVVERSPSTVVWRRSAAPRILPEVACAVTNAADGTSSIDLRAASAGAAARTGYVEIRLAYRFNGRGRFLVMAKNNISYVAGANGYVSLDPSASSATYPAYLDAQTGKVLDVRVLGPAMHELALLGCTARAIDLKDDDILPTPPSRIDLVATFK